MAAFKDEISVELAGRLAGELTAAWPAFPRRPFTGGLGDALAPLELMARVELLTDRLVETLPDDFDAAAKVLWCALESSAFTGWMTLPCGSYVARAGIDRPEVALPLLAGLTPRWSSEGPIRPFIERHPDLTYEHLRGWVSDPDEHVRRLVSEGTCPRLPWAPRLRPIIADLSPNIELLDRLVDDPSPIIDHRVHYAGADGLRRRKVFKLTRRRLAPGQPATLTRRHRFEHVSIRRIRPGRHTIDIQINGRVLGAVDVDVVDPNTTNR